MNLSDAQLGRLESPRGHEADESNPDARSKLIRELADKYWEEHPDFRAAKVTHPKRERWSLLADPAIVHGNTFRGLVLSPDWTKYTRCFQFAAGQESIEYHNLTPVLMLDENFTFPLSKSLTEPAVDRSPLLQIPFRFTSIEMMVTTGNAYCDKAPETP